MTRRTDWAGMQTQTGRRPLHPDADSSPGRSSPGRVRALVTRHQLPAFFLLALALPWVCAPVADGIFYSGMPTLLGIALALPFEILVASPLAAAIILAAVTGGRGALISLLRGFLRWRVGWCWYAVALALPPALAVLPIYLNALWGAPSPGIALHGSLSAAIGVFALRLVNPWDGPGSEELGWRGFALPRLQQRYSALTANLILAAFVMAWHLRLVAGGRLPLVALLGTLASTILFGWLYNSTRGSLLLVYLFHAADGVLKLDYAGIDATRYLRLQIGVWLATAIVIAIVTRADLGRSRTPGRTTTPPLTGTDRPVEERP